MVYRDIEHLGSFESTQEAKFARDALLRLFCALPWTYGCSMSRLTRADAWTNLLNNIYTRELCCSSFPSTILNARKHESNDLFNNGIFMQIRECYFSKFQLSNKKSRPFGYFFREDTPYHRISTISRWSRKNNTAANCRKYWRWVIC